jgi:hypothetical protein
LTWRAAHRARHSTANAARRAAVQDVPTLTGSGFTGFAALQWYGVAGRAGPAVARHRRPWTSTEPMEVA